MKTPDPIEVEEARAAFFGLGRFFVWFAGALRKHGWKALALLIMTTFSAGVGGTVAAIRLDIPTARDAAGTQTTEIIATTGVQGFLVAEFCADPLTKVRLLPAPDAINEGTYQLTRTRNGVNETVVLAAGTREAIHYFDTTVGQQSEPGLVTDEAEDCIEGKAE